MIGIEDRDWYSMECIKVADRVMELLDEGAALDAHSLIERADKKVLGRHAGITRRQAGYVAKIVSRRHSRGPEFLVAFNRETCGL